jgi:hypothetical protein
MFSYALATGAQFLAAFFSLSLIHFTASTYFYLPVDEEEDKDIQNYQRKYLTWVAEPSSTSPLHDTDEKDESVVKTVVSNDDLYKILGVSRQPTLDKMSLRRAYLSRSKACHPE